MRLSLLALCCSSWLMMMTYRGEAGSKPSGIPSGSPYGWLLGPDYCFQSDSFRCIRENSDPNCTDIIPWCSAHGTSSRSLSIGLYERTALNKNYRRAGWRKKLKAYYRGERQLYRQQRRNRTRSKLSLGPRIVGGDETYPGAFPWMVVIYVNKFQMCSGTLVNNDTILTAAHCVDVPKDDVITVKLGQFYLDRPEQHQEEHLAHWSCLHPHYRIDRDFDMGIIRLVNKVPYTKYIQPICRFRSEQEHRPDYYGNCLAMGYGAIRVESGDYTKPARMIRSDQLHIVGLNEHPCPSWYVFPNSTITCHYQWSIYEKAKVVLPPQQRSGVCHGDSGGPLACFDPLGKLWYQMGIIISEDHSCGERKQGFDYMFDLWKRRRDVEEIINLREPQTKVCNILPADL